MLLEHLVGGRELIRKNPELKGSSIFIIKTVYDEFEIISQCCDVSNSSGHLGCLDKEGGYDWCYYPKTYANDDDLKDFIRGGNEKIITIK